MKHIYGVKNIKLLERSIVILGNFDGIHIGHQKLCEMAKEVGDEKGFKTVLFSFYPHPTWILGDKPTALLMTREEKADRVKQLGIDIYVEYPFSLEFGQKSAEDFVTGVLLDKLTCKAVIIGDNYFFGNNQEGNVAYMQKLGHKYDFEVFVVDEVKEGNKTVSSTLIRDLVLRGNIELANKLIGQPYMVKGVVVQGKQLGRTLGFPTVNLIPDANKVLPPNGVYITKTHILGTVYDSLTNIGNNPTVNGTQKMVETFIFDFCKDVYGEKITVEIIKHVRPETKFNSLVELTNQMNKDKSFALDYIK
ncbi:MAG TPA: bifunctional riboflavin kinase/FAD synthetase [Epulopiscium sp.]|nr:bifunctional riboflavin kinase/FAD synthetase [Candidatus Epulonipiscium sp.]